MMLKADGIDVATHYNFGQPRIGDDSYARCANSFLPTERVTHLKVTIRDTFHLPIFSLCNQYCDDDYYYHYLICSLPLQTGHSATHSF